MMLKAKPLAIVSFLIALTCSGCNDSGGGGSTAPGPAPSTGPTLDARGGVVASPESDATLYGASVRIPENVLKKTTTIEIKRGRIPSPLPLDEYPAGPCVDFSPDGLIFDSPITLSLPYRDADHDGKIDGTGISETKTQVRYHDPISKKWVPMPVKSRDTVKNRIFFESRHFSVYLTEVPTKDPGDPAFEKTELWPDEYFLWEPNFVYIDGKQTLLKRGCINRPGIPCSTPFHLLVRFHRTDGLIAVMDRHPTLNDDAGFRAEITEDGTGATFDAVAIFDKVRQSGDALLWRWEADFIPELTRLKNYVPVDEHSPITPEIPEDRRIYAKIRAVDNREVLITWGVNIYQELEKAKTLCVAFEGTYIGE